MQLKKTTALHELKGPDVTLLDGTMKRREQDNRSYLMELTNRALLYNHEFEAALVHDATADGNRPHAS